MKTISSQNNASHQHLNVKERFTLWNRIFRRANFRLVRWLSYMIALLWLRKIYNEERLPQNGPAIIISNHTSYYDWALLSAVYHNKYVVFLANRDLLRRRFVSWLMRLNILIYIDPSSPGYRYFREVLHRLKQGHIVVIYPEGTRSRTGRMLNPKVGFVKLALHTGVPVVPVGMKGAYRILPPHKRFPRLKRCEIIVGEPFRINADEPMFTDIFHGKRHVKDLSEAELEKIAIRIMDRIAKMSGQEWEDPLLRRKLKK